MRSINFKALILLSFLVCICDAFSQSGRTGGGGRGGRWGDERQTLDLAVLQAIGAAAQNHAERCNFSALAETVHTLLHHQTPNTSNLRITGNATSIGAGASQCLNSAVESLLRQGRISEESLRKIRDQFRD